LCEGLKGKALTRLWHTLWHAAEDSSEPILFAATSHVRATKTCGNQRGTAAVDHAFWSRVRL